MVLGGVDGGSISLTLFGIMSLTLLTLLGEKKNTRQSEIGFFVGGKMSDKKAIV